MTASPPDDIPAASAPPDMPRREAPQPVRRAAQEATAFQALSEQSLESPLGALLSRAPVACGMDTPVREALADMHRHHVGSILVLGAGDRPVGILTRYDILGRVTLAEVPLSTPIHAVMVHPVHTLTTDHTAQDAALLMARHGIRHVPVTRDGVAVGVVSERDLFALQRLSLKHVSVSISVAQSLVDLQIAAGEIRRMARGLLRQGVHARQITALVSHLNDSLTRRLLDLKAAQHGIDLGRLCWLALGSEGRSEQTVATDQDNALILPDDATDAQREQALAFAGDVNAALDACGYPLCRGGIMAGQPGCCLTLAQWRERFAHWIEHGAPQDLLNASIYFDLRPLGGNEHLGHALQAEVLASAQATPRFLKQMALNALTRAAPLNWRGGIAVDARGTLDLKLQGAALFVDAARLYSLAHGVAATGTRDRLEAVGSRIGLDASEYQAWTTAFEFLQMLRLRVQLDGAASNSEPNRIRVADLNDIDRRVLKECLRTARSLQRRLQLDYER